MVGPCNPGHRVSCAAGAGRHLLSVHRISSNGGIDSPTRLHDPPDESDVFLLNLSVLELPGKLLMRGIVLGNHHHARGPTVQPVDDAGPHFPANTAQVSHMMEQRVDQRAGWVAGSRMHHHTWRLVENRHILILIEDVERQSFGVGASRCDLRQDDRHAVSISHCGVGAGSSPVDRHVPISDELLYLRAGMTLEY